MHELHARKQEIPALEQKTKEIIILNDISSVCPNAFLAYRFGVFVPHDGPAANGLLKGKNVP